MPHPLPSSISPPKKSICFTVRKHIHKWYYNCTRYSKTSRRLRDPFTWSGLRQDKSLECLERCGERELHHFISSYSSSYLIHRKQQFRETYSYLMNFRLWRRCNIPLYIVPRFKTLFLPTLILINFYETQTWTWFLIQYTRIVTKF